MPLEQVPLRSIETESLYKLKATCYSCIGIRDAKPGLH